MSNESRRSMLARCAAVCLTAGLTFLSGCDNSGGGGSASTGGTPTTGSTGGGSGGGAGGKKFTIGMSQANRAEPYRVQMDKDVEEAAKKHPELNVIFKDAQKDSLVQRGQVEELISQGVNLIIISPNEPAPLTEPVARAMEAGIPVIVLDRRLTGDKFTTFIGADNYLIGQGAGKWLVKHLNNKGKVVELQGMMSTDPAQKRHKGFQDAIKGSGLELVFTADMRWDQSQAKSEMESAMARAPQIDAVYAHNDPGAYGAFLAAQQAGRAQGITFVGIDALPSEGVAFVQQGSLAASFQYPTGGAEAIETALKILNGEKVEKEMVLSSKYFTKENAGQGGAPLSDVK